MTERPGGLVVIQLRPQTMDLDIYERYKLMIDASIRAELDKLKVMREQAAVKAAKLRKERTERIEKLTDGKLRYGMTRQEVIAAWGEPKAPAPGPGYQQAGRFDMEYKDYTLQFLFTLFDIVKNKEE